VFKKFKDIECGEVFGAFNFLIEIISFDTFTRYVFFVIVA
jgi:hypothetical protein